MRLAFDGDAMQTPHRRRILIIDRDPSIRNLMHFVLAPLWADILDVDVSQGLSAFTTFSPDCIVLGLENGDKEGRAIVQQAHLQTPILVLAYHGAEPTIVDALNAGADDFVFKPFDCGQLVTRLRRVLESRTQTHEGAGRIDVGDLTVNLCTHEFSLQNRTRKLSPRESELLATLARKPNMIVTTAQLQASLTGMPISELRVCMNQLRRSLGDNPLKPRVLLAEPGIGYRLLVREAISHELCDS